HTAYRPSAVCASQRALAACGCSPALKANRAKGSPGYCERAARPFATSRQRLQARSSRACRGSFTRKSPQRQHANRATPYLDGSLRNQLAVRLGQFAIQQRVVAAQAAELLVVEPCIEAIVRQQFGMGAALDDLAAIHHQNLVGRKDRGE